MAFVADFARQFPDRVAVVMNGDGAKITYSELDARSVRIANSLAQAGLGFGSAVGVLLENAIHTYEVMWACQRSGIRYTPLNTRLTVEEIAYILNDCGAEIFITSPKFAAVASEVAGLTPNVRRRFCVSGSIDGHEDLDAIASTMSDAPEYEELEGHPMMYSSGTTGKPKGVKRGHTRAPAGSAAPIAVFMTTPMAYDEQTVYLNPAPLYHAAPMGWSMAVHRYGGTVVCMDHFNEVDALQLIEKHGVTHAQFVPTMFVRMLKLPASERTRFDLSSLRAVVHAAAPCPVEVKQQMIEWWGNIIYEYCAATEGHGITWIGPEEWLSHPGSVGKPLLGEIHICADDLSELPRGEVGVIWFGGVPVQLEYHNDPAKTAESTHPQGWLTVWDMGWVDEDGYLYLTDRKSHMIISGGVNIYPQESEDLLIAHPMVADAAVIGVPDDEMGEQVKGVVILADPSKASPEVERELIDYLKTRLASYKCPKSIDFVTELPRQENGKLIKRALRDRYWSAKGSRII